jgi:hypothetical protein
LLQVVHMPWLVDGGTLGSLPASSLTALECSVDTGCERLVASLSSLTALNSLRIWYSSTKNGFRAGLWDLSDSAFAPLLALLQLTQLQLTQLQLWAVRAQQLAHLQLPQLQQLTAFVARVHPVWEDDQPHQFDVSHLLSLTLLHINSHWMQGDGFPSSLREVTWQFPSTAIQNPEVAKQLSAQVDLQPLLQLGALEKVQLIFNNLKPARLQEGLLHTLPQWRREHNSWHHMSKSGKQVVWRTAASAAQQGALGDEQPAAAAAAAEATWRAAPLRSVRLMYDKLRWGFASMPTATVQALGALQLTELAIHGGFLESAYLGLEVTPAQLGEVLQRLPLLQRLESMWFALLCDAEFANPADVSALLAPQQQQQQQQEEEEQQVCMQPCHLAAGVTALVSAIGQLHKLQALQLELPLLIRPNQAGLQEVESALERWLPRWHLQNHQNPWHVCAGYSAPPLYVLCPRPC